MGSDEVQSDSAMDNNRSMPTLSWETGSAIQDPNTIGLAAPERVLYSLSIFHDGQVTAVACDSTGSSVSLKIHSFIGRDELAFSCRITFVGVTEASLKFDGTDIYSMELALEGESGYRVKICTAYEVSDLDFLDVVVSDWEETETYSPPPPLVFHANCKFSSDLP